MLSESLALIISWIGVFAGFGLAKLAKEEVAAGNKNLKILKLILFISTSIIFIPAFISKINIVSVLILFAVLLIWVWKKNDYVVLAAVYGLYPNFLICTLIFLYGLPAGSLMYREKPITIIKKTLIYPILGLILLLI